MTAHLHDGLFPGDDLKHVLRPRTIAEYVAYGQHWGASVQREPCPSGCELFAPEFVGKFLRAECYACPHPQHDDACDECKCVRPQAEGPAQEQWIPPTDPGEALATPLGPVPKETKLGRTRTSNGSEGRE